MIKAKKLLSIVPAIAGLFFPALVSLQAAEDNLLDTEAILKEFIADYAENDRLPEAPLVFGMHITGPDESRWTIAIDADRSPPVTLSGGLPDVPAFVCVTDRDTLNKIYRGEINALTAAGRARMSDKAPLDFEFIHGFQPDPAFLSEVMLPLGFHFFTRGKPEIIFFGEDHSRFVHGGNAVIFYYQQGLRTGWYQVKKGMKINADLDDAVNPFPTLFVFTKGKGQGRLGEKTIPLQEGMSVFVPPGMIHQFWTEEDDGLEFIIIMFGEGA